MIIIIFPRERRIGFSFDMRTCICFFAARKRRIYNESGHKVSVHNIRLLVQQRAEKVDHKINITTTIQTETKYILWRRKNLTFNTSILSFFVLLPSIQFRGYPLLLPPTMIMKSGGHTVFPSILWIGIFFACTMKKKSKYRNELDSLQPECTFYVYNVCIVWCFFLSTFHMYLLYLLSRWIFCCSFVLFYFGFSPTLSISLFLCRLPLKLLSID